ncbi:hypothetical protein [Blastopirellula marina]|uniref:Uncharacterized protein n=1 Tax=Blastopirellula marina TaxID=124 RepID=A0A2S8FTH0_9BACT|nr:hypothetical protein [Blastopirellula marina]PQO35482.1 hypothetical protein C5Y98_14075 [Blastopirellula marina]PQO41344.1 hypothetical protein C5Y93_29960 [Blastopirellula marina]PTL44122.1 hypothetical protein C5Y97_14085 [Blastopirellula marina]
MLIANCPHCNDPIRIPGAADSSSRVRCPWCEETYLLADVFEHLPPLVEVLEGPGSQADISIDSDDEYQLAGVAAPDFNFKDSEGTGSSSPAPLAKVEGRSTSSARRPAKSSSNPAWEAFKVVGGGVFGIIIAMFAVMWVSGDDKFHMVQYLPSFAYFAVPENLWTEEMRTAAGKKEESPGAEGETKEAKAGQPAAKPEPAKPAAKPAANENSKVEKAVDEGMSSLGAAFNEAKNRGENPPPDLGKSDFVPPPEKPIVVKPSPKVDSDVVAELSKLTAEIGPIGAQMPAKEEPEPPKRREPNVSLDPAGK